MANANAGRAIGDRIGRSWRIAAISGGAALLRHVDSGEGVVVGLTDSNVQSLLPSDQPRDGGAWSAWISDSGVAYVARTRSWAAARAAWRRYRAAQER
jgi:hypothetical protein